MEPHLRIVAIGATVFLLLGVVELVRRRALLERYALVWMGSAFVLLLLAAWSGLLTEVASAIGIIYPPSALFVIAFGFVLFLLLHFSVAVSRLTDQTKVLAQRIALLEERQHDSPADNSDEDYAEEDESQRSPPVRLGRHPQS